ncbi:hypothetical protein J132_07997 [Termitomyces sp. J132]|nr:hypothetical protein J132_07997 [Termitomyces sp. J132]
MMLIDNKEEVECITDSGSQIILMSVEVASKLGLFYDPNIVLNMQSANGPMDQLLGLACNVPCIIGDITVYLQIHVLQSPIYNIHLGHPFDVLTQSVVNTLSDIETTITIMDPNTGMQCTILTFLCTLQDAKPLVPIDYELIKQPHFNVCQALFKAVYSDQAARWSTATYSVFWSEHVTVCKQMCCSPYYVTISTHPLLPANIVEVTYLQPLPNLFLSTTDLITCLSGSADNRSSATLANPY